MLVKIGMILLVAVVVFFIFGRGWPKFKTLIKTRVLPLVLSPIALPILKRVFWVLLRILFRR